MTDQVTQSDVANLTVAVAANTKSTKDLARRAKNSHIQIIVLGVSIVLDLVLSVGMLVSLHTTSEAQDAAKRAQENSCAVGNESRAGLRDLVDTVDHIVVSAVNDVNSPIVVQVRDELAAEKAKFPARSCP